MKKMKHILLSTVTVLSISACGSDCTEEELQDKLKQMTVEIQGMAADGDMSKLMEFSQKAQKISLASQGEGDLQAACDAVDDLMNEL